MSLYRLPTALGAVACSTQPRTPVLRHRLQPSSLRALCPRQSGLSLCRGSLNQSTSTSEEVGDKKLKATISDLDAILGIQPEEAKDETPKAASASVSAEALQNAISPDAKRAIGVSEGPNSELDGLISDQMKKILEKAKQMADEQARSGTPPPASDAASSPTGQQQLRREFEQLLNIVFSTEQGVDKADLQKLKDSGVFGPLSFWVTEIRNLDEPAGGAGASASAGSGAAGSIARAGVLIRGNLRAGRAEVFAALCAKVRELFGEKYEVLMLEDPEAMGDEPPAPTPQRGGAAGSSGAARDGLPEPRVAFTIVPAALAQPPQSGGWNSLVSGVLLLLLFGSCVQLALVANLTKLPKETLEYLANPDAAAAGLAADALPPGLAGWDPAAYLACAVPIFGSVVGVNFIHEVGHRIAAAIRGVKLGPSYFIPNLQIGSFGAITPLQSLVKSRRDLWDVAAAGPIAGGLASLALLAIGMQQSAPGVLPPELLVPVPTQLFQGSLLLGGLTRLALGGDALHSGEALLSPLAIAGWCGLITTSLNLLPVGSLDGGRMMQAAFGQPALSLSSFFTYVGLGLGLLGSSLSLPFGLYVLICQRSAERYIQDSVGPVSGAKQAATAVAVLTAILILLPMAPEIADSVGVGPGPADLFL